VGHSAVSRWSCAGKSACYRRHEVLEFRILGALDVHDDGRRIEFREGNDAALLTLLLLHAGQPLSVDRIVDELWPDDPPASARKIVQNSVSHLRRALGEKRLETRGHAYVLHADADEIDAAQFEQLVTDGRGADALHLWRGPPALDGERFEELHLTALEQRLAADVDAGRSGTIAELDTLVRRHPYRERLRALQMRALYADGRQADALDAYRAAARTLRAALGLEPGPELRELEQAILRHDVPATPDAPPPRAKRRRYRLGAVAAVAALAVVLAAVLGNRGSHKPVVVVPNSIAVIDPASDRVVRDIRVGAMPTGLAVGAGGIWVANTGDQTVTRINPKTLLADPAIGVGGAAIGIAIAGRTLWIATDGDGTVVRLDTGTGAQQTYAMPNGSGTEAVAVGHGAVWVAESTVYKVDPRTGKILLRPNTDCCTPVDVLSTPQGIWTNAHAIEDVVRLSPRTLHVVGRVHIPLQEWRLAYGYGALWISASNTVTGRAHPRSAVWKVNPQSTAIEAQTAVGAYADAIAVGEGAVWVANRADNTISKLSPDTAAVVDTIRVGGSPTGIAVGEGRVWVSVS